MTGGDPLANNTTSPVTIENLPDRDFGAGCQQALYSNQCISERLKDLAVTRKKASIEAYQALNEDVQLRVYTFWNYPLPLGIFQVPLFRLIDFDEFGVTLLRCNCSFRWALKVFCVRKDGHYKVGRTITILFAIEPGDLALPPHVRGGVANP